MENNLVLGTFNVPYCNEDESVSYVAPAILAPEMMKKITFGETVFSKAKKENKTYTQIKEEEVTHGVFFGENIKRITKALTHG